MEPGRGEVVEGLADLSCDDDGGQNWAAKSLLHETCCLKHAQPPW